MKKMRIMLVAIFAMALLGLTLAACKTDPASDNRQVVTFDYNYAGAPSPSEVRVDKGEAVSMPATPQRANFTFVAWCTDADGNTPWEFADPVDKNMRLYAAWVAAGAVVTYKVTFNTGVEGVTVAEASVVRGATVSKPADPINPGFTLAGWYTELAHINPYNFASPVTKKLTLYAKWDITNLSKEANDYIAAIALLPVKEGVIAIGPAKAAEKLITDAGLDGNAMYIAIPSAERTDPVVVASKQKLDDLKDKIIQVKNDAAVAEFVKFVEDNLSDIEAVTEDNLDEAKTLSAEAKKLYDVLTPALQALDNVKDAYAVLARITGEIGALEGIPVSGKAEFDAAWMQAIASGDAIILTGDFTLDNVIDAASGTYQVTDGQEITIRSSGIRRTITLENYARFLILTSGKITFENVNIIFNTTCRYLAWTSPEQTSAAVEIFNAATPDAAVYTFIDCEVKMLATLTTTAAASFFQSIKGAGGDNGSGTFNIIRSTVVANHRTLGQSGNAPHVVYNLIDADIKCTTDGDYAVYRGNANLYGTTVTGAIYESANYAVKNDKLGTYPDWYTPPAG